MMYSMEKCLGRNGTGTSEEAELFTGAPEGLVQEGVPSDDVVLVSAVAAVSHEIGDILKDELGDAECADRIGAELADLSAELGLLAGLTDVDTQQDFPTLLKIAMGTRECESSGSSSSSSWSRARAGARRPPRPARLTRRRPIAKGKEVSRRRSAAARRAASLRAHRVELVSDASDVGADSDSDDQWTELDNSASGSASGSGSSSGSESSSKSAAEMDEQFRAEAAEPPQLRQFLLPLISNVPNSVQFRIRHDDIVQLLATEEEEQKLPDLPPMSEGPMNDGPDELSADDMFAFEEPPVSTEEEAALLHYVCGGERGSMATFQPTEEWLLGVFHSWCEVSALIYTLIGTDASAHRVCGPWAYRVRLPCHCRLCICAVRAEAALAALLRDLVWALAHGGSTVPNAAHIMRALRLSGDVPLAPEDWDLPRLKRIRFSDEGAAIIHNQLVRYSQQNETARQVITIICNCRGFEKPLEKQYAVERLIRILECYKSASIVNFKVEMVPLNDDPETNEWLNASREKLERYLEPYQDSLTAARIQYMAARTKPARLSMWEGYEHNCDCITPKILCALQRKQLLRSNIFRSIYSRMSVFGLKHSAAECDETELPIQSTPGSSQKTKKPAQPATTSGELQQGDGTGAKPPDSTIEEQVASAPDEPREQPALVLDSESEKEQSDPNADDSSFLTVSESESAAGSGVDVGVGVGVDSLASSSSSPLDSASELLMAAAHCVDSDAEPAPTQLCRTVRHLMRSISSIEKHMDTVLKQCDEWPSGSNDVEARKQVDLGLSAVDRKLMAMYRRLPEVHKRQLQVYRKQKKLSTVCMQLVGGAAPAPPPPGSPPPAPHYLPRRTLCPEYHLQRFKEVRRKVMHMRDQQLYYHRLRMWLEDQLRQERERPDSNVALLEEPPRRRRRASSPRFPRLSTATKRKLKPTNMSKPHRILQLLKHKAQTTQLLNDIKHEEEASPPEAFPLDRDDNISDADTIVGERDVDMNEVIATLAQMALSPDKRIQAVMAELKEEYEKAVPTPTDSEEYPESVSPPLQEMSPTNTEPSPVFAPKTQRLMVNKFTDKEFNAQITPDLNVPLNARRTPVLVKEEAEKETDNAEVAVYKDPNIYKYITFGLEIKKAMEECQNIINSYNSIKTEGKETDGHDGPLSLEQICEVMMSLDKNSAEFLNKIDTDEPIDLNTANTKLAELVENMPQILANMPQIYVNVPDISNEFANASYELPEFASIMSNMPDVNSETQLTPETLKQIRDLKLSKNRDSVKVTKNTAKRKISRKIKNNIDTSDIIGTLTFEFDSKDIVDLLNDEKELQALMITKSEKEDLIDLVFTISAQVIINNILDIFKVTRSPEINPTVTHELLALPKNIITIDMYFRAAAIFNDTVIDDSNMEEVKEAVNSRFHGWKIFIMDQFKCIPEALLETEIASALQKFYKHIKDISVKQTQSERNDIIEKIEGRKPNYESEEEISPTRESLKQITKILSVSVGNTFDLLLMKMSKITGEKREVLKNMRINYVDVLKRCAESQQLVGWILSDPDLAASHIQDLMGFDMRKEKAPDFSTMSMDKKRAYFMDRLKAINRHFMDNVPKKSVTGDDWLMMLYKLELFENKIKEALVRFSPPVKTVQQASEAEILAAKGLSKIIGKANNVKVKKELVSEAKPAAAPVSAPAPAPASIPAPAPEDSKPEPQKPKESSNTRRDVILKCDTLIAQKGSKTLKDSFDAIKLYLAGDATKPDNYYDHVMAIVSNLDYSALDDEIVEVLRFGGITISPPVPTTAIYTENTIQVKVPTHNPEELAKYSAQALRNAKQTLNAVAFKNLTRNGQSKSESDISSCDVPSSECKYTSDCMCTACKRDRSICLGDIVKISFDTPDPDKCKLELEEKKKEVKEVKVKTPAKAKPVPKQCENATHQQHVCKVGHTSVGNGSCTGDGGDQHCTCCYCTVFGHAPPLTTPVPRNFNETRERLRSILNKKKQLCKTANGEQYTQQEKQSPQPERKQASVQTQATPPQPITPQKLVQPQPKPPALPKTLPPNLTAQAQAKRQALDNQQRMLADKMAKMVVTEKPEIKPVALQRTVPVQVNVPPSLKTEGKVNPNAMEQIRLQQLKQQQQAQYQQQIAQQIKPEPIYDLPIHNKPPQQQQQIRQELQKQQLQKQVSLQQKLQQNPVVQINAQVQTQTPPLPTTTLQQNPQQETKPLQQLAQQKVTPQQIPAQQVQQKLTPQTSQQIPAAQVQQQLTPQQIQQIPAPQVQQKLTPQQLQQIPAQLVQQKLTLQQIPAQQVPQKLTMQQIPQKLTLHQLPGQQIQQNLTLQQVPAQQAQQKLTPHQIQQVQQIQAQQKLLQAQQAQQKAVSQQVQQKPTQQIQPTPTQQVQQKPPQPVNRVVQPVQQKSTQPPQQIQQKPVQQPQQLLQKPPIQQAPRKPPPQELQQKLAQKQQPMQLQQKIAQTLAQKPVIQPQTQSQVQQKPMLGQPVPKVPLTLAQQQQQQQYRQQYQLQQQQQQQQRQARQPNQTSVSLSSRDTSVFSTSSGCSDGSCWQGRAEDTRDLDALLQYIEGPARHVDRGKKKAKKQRQKAKKTEEKLEAECTQLKTEFARVRFEAEALGVAHYSAKRRCEETRKTLQGMSAQTATSKSRKKQNKLNPVQKQQVQVLAEQVGEFTALMHITAKRLKTAEAQVTECSHRLRCCEKEINEARETQGKNRLLQFSHKLQEDEMKLYEQDLVHERLLDQKHLLLQEKLKLEQTDEALRLRTNQPEAAVRLRAQQHWTQHQIHLQEAQRHQHHQLQMHQLKQQRQLQMEQEMINRLRIDEAKLLKQQQNEAIAKADRLKASSSVSSDRGASLSSASSVSSTCAEGGALPPEGRSSCDVTQPQRIPNDNRHIIITKHVEEEELVVPQVKQDPARKSTQTWEQALAHINQVAKGGKDKKYQKPPAAPVKPDIKAKELKPVQIEAPSLTKKQKKKLAQQQAEEEERLHQEQLQKEAKNKKARSEPATPAVPAEPLTKKAEKKLEQAKRAEQAKTKKEAKRERKLEKKAEKKEEKKAEKKEEKKAKEKETKDKEVKEKEHKLEKNVHTTSATKASKPTPPPIPPPPMQTKKERKREQQLQQKQQEQQKQEQQKQEHQKQEHHKQEHQKHEQKEKPHVVNITPHTTIEVVNNKSASAGQTEKPASCSIMEQLSCGIQVSELRLPPGITLTRVHPNEKKEPPPIKSVPLWKANQLPAAPTPVARPVPVINADPSMMMFSTAHPEQPPKPVTVAEPPPITIGKSKKSKKKAKKAAASAEDSKPAATKMVTLRNPMFHPNLPPVQISSPPVQVANPKKAEIRLPDPIPMPPNACQATITPTSNGMYTIRNPLMSMMHQQSMMGVRNPTPPFNQPQYSYPNPNSYNQAPGQYVIDPARSSPKPDDYQNRIMNLASFTQTNDEGYSLFKTTDIQQKSFLTPEYYTEDNPKPVVSPNPIGTRPEMNRTYESDNSLFANPVQRPEPIGTPLKKDEDRSEYTGLYTPFGVENPNLFRNALFNERNDVKDDMAHLANGDLPYFQRLRVGSKLNNEVTIHHVTESKFYRQETPQQSLDELALEDSLFSRPVGHVWPESGPIYPNPAINQPPVSPPVPVTPTPIEPRYGAVGTRPHKDHNVPEGSLFFPDATISNLSSLEACEREVESFKRFEWYFSPPEHKPKMQLHVSDIGNSMKK